MPVLRLFVLAALLFAPLPLAAQTVPASAEQVRLSFAPVVRKAAPAVVNIYTRKVVRTAHSPLLADPFFRRFFGDMLPPGMSQERVQNSLGSGVIVGSEGVVVTNHHVIKGADEVTVVLADRREFEAKVLGSDEKSDLAVLRINPKGQELPILPFGDSDAIEVGDLVLAIGNPFGVGQTVTSGIVSALARTNVGITDYRSFIQTDAAINPGNSGGALVDVGGRLIGINTAIYSKDGGSNGIGFAIPTALVKAVLASIKEGGKVVHPWIGASFQAVTPDIAQAMGMARPVGVLLDTVHRDGPAARAGLRPGDVVVRIEGREVDDPEALRFRLATLAIGSEAALAVLRNGVESQVRVRLIAPPEVPPRNVTEIGGRTPLSGAEIANLNPALAEEIGVGSEIRGVVVLRIRRGSVAHRLQIGTGDIILRINDRAVASVDDVRRALAVQAEAWRITINRGGQTLSLVIGG